MLILAQIRAKNAGIAQFLSFFGSFSDQNEHKIANFHDYRSFLAAGTKFLLLTHFFL